MTILLVESDKLLADNFSTVANLAGHKTVWQVDLQSAIESIDNDKPDAVVIDINLANRSGVELLYELRSYPEWQNLQVLVWSDVASSRDGLPPGIFDNLGISSYNHKPTTS